jgi:hypothetical protein
MTYRLLLLLLLVAVSCGKKAATKTLIDAEADSVIESETSTVEESENVELARRAKEDEAIYNEMNVYDGEYMLYTESEGADGNLTLKYLGDKVSKFSLKLTVPDMCDGVIEDTAYVDRTQHAFYRSDKCLLHFELLGQNIEITAEDGCDKMKGDCSFSGVYQSVAI